MLFVSSDLRVNLLDHMRAIHSCRYSQHIRSYYKKTTAVPIHNKLRFPQQSEQKTDWTHRNAVNSNGQKARI